MMGKIKTINSLKAESYDLIIQIEQHQAMIEKLRNAIKQNHQQILSLGSKEKELNKSKDSK